MSIPAGKSAPRFTLRDQHGAEVAVGGAPDRGAAGLLKSIQRFLIVIKLIQRIAFSTLGSANRGTSQTQCLLICVNSLFILFLSIE